MTTMYLTRELREELKRRIDVAARQRARDEQVTECLECGETIPELDSRGRATGRKFCSTAHRKRFNARHKRRLRR